MKKTVLFFICICLASGIYSQSITRLIGCSPYQNTYWILDTSSFNIITSQTLSQIGGMTIQGVTGLAKHPITGVYYMVAKTSTGRYLGTLNPVTGAVTLAGNLNDNFSQITFNGNNSLLGVTGSGGFTLPSVFRINPVNGSNVFMDVVYYNYGQVITYNPTDNSIYHLAGNDDMFEKLDTIAPFTSTFITNPNGLGETAGMVYRSNNVFLASSILGDLNYIDGSGNSYYAGSAPDALKGIAYITCPRLISGSYTFCAGANTTLSMSANGTAYQWYKNNIAVPGATLANITTSISGHYNCIITDGCGVDSLANGVTVQQMSLPGVVISGSNIVCSGQTITLNGSGGGTSQWYKNGILIPGATSNTYAVFQAGVYNMIKTNLNGCSDSASVGKTITVAASPTITIGVLSNTICSGETTTLTSSGANSYTWNTGPNTSSLAVSPTVTTSYSVIGTNSVTGCTNTNSVTIIVSLCNGVQNKSTNVSLIVSPNPTKGFINIESGSEIVSYEIIDLTGKVTLKGKEINTSKINVNLSHLDDSIYFIRATTSDGKTIQSKIILSK